LYNGNTDLDCGYETRAKPNLITWIA
jgi:hypothetical protein